MKNNLIEKLTANNYTIKEQTEADNKKNRIFALAEIDNKKVVIAQIVYNNKKEAYQIKANRKFTKAEYHESWSMKYARKYEKLTEVITAVKELERIYKAEATEKQKEAEAKQKAKKEAEAKKQKETKQKTEAKKTEQKQKATEKKTETKQKQTTTKKQTTKKATIEDLKQKAKQTTTAK